MGKRRAARRAGNDRRALPGEKQRPALCPAAPRGGGTFHYTPAESEV